MPGPAGRGLLIDAVRERLRAQPCPIVGTSRDSGLTSPGADELRIDRLVTKPFSISLLRHLARELIDDAPDRRELSHPDRRT